RTGEPVTTGRTQWQSYASTSETASPTTPNQPPIHRKTRRLEQARSDLIATASHELRTPVTAVYGAARTLLREDIELSEQERLTFLQVIESEGERLARIVNQILLAGQLDEGDLQLAPEACDLADVAAGVIETATRGREERSPIRLRASKALPPVQCDEERFRQVLGNLLENA